MDTDYSVRSVEAATARAAELKGSLDVIPKGVYCYRPLGPGHEDAEGNFRYPIELCPYWAMDPSKPHQENGYCAFTKLADWEDNGGITHLWDQVKECGIDDDFVEEEEEEVSA
ncbi:MAG: hypothetical protein EOR63_32125 [Mesorhizobium sp.]|nr:MAG: hypothetical protein EOR63_32125 [Mesorhizobium sp.]